MAGVRKLGEKPTTKRKTSIAGTTGRGTGSRRTRRGGASASRRTSRPQTVSSENRYRMIQEAAYFIAENDGFLNDPYNCWLRAEAQIDSELSGR